MTKSAGHAFTIASNLNLTEFRGVICISGDGLLYEVVNGMFFRSDWQDVIRNVSIGIIPG